MKIGIASDHRGYELKEKLKKELINYEIVDYGTNSTESVDYPDFGIKLAEEVAKNNVDFGIAICGSGIGISIACNKVKGIRCAKVDTKEEVVATRYDNDSNIIAFSGDMDFSLAKELVMTFITTDFSNIERHKRRINKIRLYEDKRDNNEC